MCLALHAELEHEVIGVRLVVTLVYSTAPTEHRRRGLMKAYGNLAFGTTIRPYTYSRPCLQCCISSSIFKLDSSELTK